MRFFNIKYWVIMAAIGLGLLIAGSSDANAQSRREIERERQRIEREQRRMESRRQRRDSEYRSRSDRGYTSAAFEQGYRYGLIAGQSDRRSGKYGRSNVYRDTGRAPNEGDPSSIDYQYRQGYLRGYEDGFNSPYRY